MERLSQIEAILAQMKEEEKVDLALVRESYKMRRQDLVREREKILRQKRHDNWQEFLLFAMPQIMEFWRINYQGLAQYQIRIFGTRGRVMTKEMKTDLPVVGQGSAKLALEAGEFMDKGIAEIRLIVEREGSLKNKYKQVWTHQVDKSAWKELGESITELYEKVKEGKLPAIK